MAFCDTAPPLEVPSGTPVNVTPTTFAAAVSNYNGTNTVLMMAAGTYELRDLIGVSGASSSNRLAFHSKDGRDAAVWRGTFVNSVVNIWDCDHLIFSGIKFVGRHVGIQQDTWGIVVGRQYPTTDHPCTYLTFTNCTIDGRDVAEHTLHIGGDSSNILVEHCHIVGGTEESVYIGYSNSTDRSHDITINCNKIEGVNPASYSGNEAIDVKPGPYNVTISNNDIFGHQHAHSGTITSWWNTAAGGTITGVDPNVSILNNRIYNCTATGTVSAIAFGGEGHLIAGNLIFNNTAAAGGTWAGGIVRVKTDQGSDGGDTIVAYNTSFGSGSVFASEGMGHTAFGWPGVQYLYNRSNGGISNPTSAYTDTGNITNATSSHFEGSSNLTGTADNGAGPGSSFRLASGAPGETTGAAVAGYTVDIFGTTLPGSSLSVGAFYYGAGSIPAVAAGAWGSWSATALADVIGSAAETTAEAEGLWGAWTATALATAEVSGGSATAVVTVEIGFAAAWDEIDPTWTDVTDHVRSVDIRMGRSPSDPYRWEIGRATVVLNNHSSQWDPWYVSATSPAPNAPIRVTVVRDTETDVLFRGFIPPRTGWSVTSESQHESYVTVQAHDLLGIIAGYDVPVPLFTATTGEGDMVHERITDVLDQAGVPVAWRDIDNSEVPLQATGYGVNALAHLQQLAVTEGVTSALYVRKDGQLTFDNKHSYLDPFAPARFASAQRSFDNDDVGDPRYVRASRSWADLFNVWRASNGEFSWADSDPTSYGAYGYQVYESTLLAQSTTDVVGWVYNGMILWRDNYFDWDEIECFAYTDEATVDACAETDLRDRVEVRIVLTGLAGIVGEYTSEAQVIGIRHQIRPGKRWRTWFQLESLDRWDNADGSWQFVYADGSAVADGSKEAAP